MYILNTKGKPSIFIWTPNDERILINGGANSDIIRNLTSILPFYSRRIDTVIVTSDDENDVTGLVDVISRYNVGKVIIPKITAESLGFSLASTTDQIYEILLDKVNQLKIPIKEVERGDIIMTNTNTKLNAEVLFPVDQFKYSKSSLPEMVLKISYGNTSILLLGNVGLKAQKSLIASTRTEFNNCSSNCLTSDVLVVSHNFSTSSLSASLINAVHPKYLVYSQTVSNLSFRLSSGPKPPKVDPIYMIPYKNRFNIKQKNTVMVLSDGTSIEVI